MSVARTMRISASALTAERLRMDVIANNIANAQTTGPDGPYRRQRVVVQALGPEASPAAFGNVLRSHMVADGGTPHVVGSGVRVVRVEEDQSPGPAVYEPRHPDADENGYVTYPNVNVAAEMVDLLSATRAYEANVTVVNALKSMALKALSIGSR
ncbi:MAG: flagellar basal body rod protein FlgC [Anaerolineae bacterium]|nr:flagellar basal body rod protein FlgC [Anaerolineae bacterium]